MNCKKYLNEHYPVMKQMPGYPFDSDVKKMSVVFENLKQSQQMVYTKGAVERPSSFASVSSGLMANPRYDRGDAKGEF